MAPVRRMIVAIAACLIGSLSAGLVQAQDTSAEEADYQARLKAGREAAYAKYLLQPAYAPKAKDESKDTGGSASTGSTGATFRASGTIATPSWTVSAAGSNVGSPYVALQAQSYAPAVRTARYNFNYNYRYGNGEPSYSSAIFHSNYEPRDRRSWPRPVQTRTWIPTHWVWDGSKYHYVRGYAVYETRWVIVGRERWHYNGSHYSVTKSFR